MSQLVFDPPPDRLAVPWGYLAALGLAGVLGGLLAIAFGSSATVARRCCSDA